MCGMMNHYAADRPQGFQLPTFRIGPSFNLHLHTMMEVLLFVIQPVYVKEPIAPYWNLQLARQWSA